MDLDFFMRQALEMAHHASLINEVPIGAVVVDAKGNIISKTHNLRHQSFDPTGHAEVLALRNAGMEIKNWRLLGCSIFVTLEPCVMCMGALINARVTRLVYGASDPKAGSISNKIFHPAGHNLNHQVEVIAGIMEVESKTLLSDFFKSKR